MMTTTETRSAVEALIGLTEAGKAAWRRGHQCMDTSSLPGFAVQLNQVDRGNGTAGYQLLIREFDTGGLAADVADLGDLGQQARLYLLWLHARRSSAGI